MSYVTVQLIPFLFNNLWLQCTCSTAEHDSFGCLTRRYVIRNGPQRARGQPIQNILLMGYSQLNWHKRAGRITLLCARWVLMLVPIIIQGVSIKQASRWNLQFFTNILFIQSGPRNWNKFKSFQLLYIVTQQSDIIYYIIYYTQKWSEHSPHSVYSIQVITICSDIIIISVC